MTMTICSHAGLAVGQIPKRSVRPREEMARASTTRKRTREALMASAAYANVWPTSRQTSRSPRTDQAARYGSACSIARSTKISTRVVAAAACGNRCGANMVAATAGAVFTARHRGQMDHSTTLFSMVVSSMATEKPVGQSHARHELLPEAGARHERMLEAVSSMPWLGLRQLRCHACERHRDSPSVSCYPLGNMEHPSARGRGAWHHEPQAPSMPTSGGEYIRLGSRSPNDAVTLR